MSSILFLTSSPRGAASYSTRVAERLVERLRAADPGARVVRRDLGAEALPYLDGDFVGGLFAPPEGRSPGQRVAIERSDALVEELLAADSVVVASAMINFGVTATLKSWIDHVTRAGVTFRYSEAGVPEGLVKGKKVYLVAARGGVYSLGEARAMDFQVPYLLGSLGFLGMTGIEVIPVEGTIFGPEAAEKAVQAALAQVEALAA